MHRGSECAVRQIPRPELQDVNLRAANCRTVLPEKHVCEIRDEVVVVLVQTRNVVAERRERGAQSRELASKKACGIHTKRVKC